jgi:hypothetical protein
LLTSLREGGVQAGGAAAKLAATAVSRRTRVAPAPEAFV